MLIALAMVTTLASFRDASLEERCDALVSYVTTFAAETLKDKAFKAGGCGEGNGLGGAAYTFDFKTGDKAEDHRLTVTWENDAAPVKVSVKPPLEPLEQAVAVWAGAKPSSLKIYGKSYDDFVKGVLAYEGYFPVVKKDKPATIRFKLVPGRDPREGSVVFEDKADEDFLACFQCADTKCLNDEVRYRFQDRFFALSRKAAENYGAGWIVEGPTPIASGGSAWKFVCGVSRYSLEKVNL